MSRSLVLALGLIGALLVSGCNKKDAGVAVQPVVTDAPATDPSGIPQKDKPTSGPSHNDVPVDLSQYLIWGEIGLPPGTSIARRDPDVCVFQCGPTFEIEIELAKRDLAASKQAWEPKVANWLMDGPTRLVAEVRGEAGTTFAFELHNRIGDQIYSLRSPAGKAFTRDEVTRMLQSARTLRQTDAINAAASRDAEAIKALDKAGCDVRDLGNSRALQFLAPIADDELARTKDVAGVTRVNIENTDMLSPAGIAHLTAIKDLENLVLGGKGVTDASIAPLGKLSALRGLTLESHAVTDAGLASLAGCKRLEGLVLRNESKPPAPSRLTGAGFVHLHGLPALEAVVVSGEPISDAGLEKLAGVKTLKQLAFIGGRFTDEGVGHLRTLTSLQVLSIRDVPISDGGVQRLGDLNKLERLTLMGTQVRGSGLSAISTLPKLREVNLQYSPIGDNGVSNLHGSAVEELDLSYTAVTDRGLAALPDLADLAKLRLRGTRITDAALVHLGRVKSLSFLDLFGTDVTGSGLTHFKGRPTLEFLSLSNTPLNEETLAELAGCPKLVALDLDATPITDKAFEKLRDVKSLRILGVGATDVSPTAIERFKADQHPRFRLNATVHAVEPDPKAVSPPVAIDKLPAADPQALARKYAAEVKTDEDATDKPVVSIRLAGSAVTDEDLAHLRGWKKLRAVNLSGCRNVTDAGLAYLGTLPELTELNLNETKVTGDGLMHLRGLTGLVSLELPGEPITLKQAAPLAALKDLERLKIKLPRNSYDTLRFLAGFPKLKEIDLRGWSRLSNHHLSIVGKMQGLERLDLSDPFIGDRGLGYLKDLKSLKELRLDSDLATDVGLQSLGSLVGLKLLEVSGRRFGNNGFLAFRTLTELERVKVSRTNLNDGGMIHFPNLTKLIELELRGANISNNSLARLTELKNLEWIDLSETNVTDDGLKHLRGMDELRKLSLEDTRITGMGFAALAKLPRLYRLHLSRSQVSDDGLIAIAKLETLEDLELSGTAITDAGVVKLKVLPNLKQLTLDRTTGLTDKVVETLKELPALTQIAVRQTSLSPKAIAELKKKEGLTVQTD